VEERYGEEGAVTALAVSGLRKSFGAVRAVDGVSFAVNHGEMVALIGPNGAGKSTCFNMIGGQLRPDSGEVLLEGRSVAGLPARRIFHLGVGRTFQVAATFASMTVIENIQLAFADNRIYRMAGPLSSSHHAAVFLHLLSQVGMADAAHRPCRELAYGDLKRVELAMALANGPRLLLMDEPTAGMAPGEQSKLMALVRELAKGFSIAVLFTEHSMDMVFEFADRVLVMSQGRLIAEGNPAAIRDNAQVQEVYLGTGKAFSKAAPVTAPATRP
jgi:branched-chain amino acid transport system ATP-binding protein